jgi:hypothetical protein
MFLLVFQGFSAGTAGRPQKSEEERVHLEKRGPLAWTNHAAYFGLSLAEGGTTRLLVHAVADVSMAMWLPKVREAIFFASSHSLEVSTHQDKDVWIATYFDHMCYALQKHPSAGSLVLFGILCMYPESKGKLPLAARSLKSWTKLVSTNEGGPIPEEVVWLIALDMVQQGSVLEACWVLTQYDIYGREQDLEQLKFEDVHYDGKVMALDLGVSARGESTKTGSNQGVVVRRGFVVAILLCLRSLCKPGKKVFPVSQAQFRKVWHTTCKRLGIEFAGPPHNLRHSGPSNDLQKELTTLELVRRRGRWKVMESVQR